jgi:hypothetical protein
MSIFAKKLQMVSLRDQLTAKLRDDPSWQEECEQLVDDLDHYPESVRDVFMLGLATIGT